MTNKRGKAPFFADEEFLSGLTETQNDYVDTESKRGKAPFFTDEPVLPESQDVQKGYRDHATNQQQRGHSLKSFID